MVLNLAQIHARNSYKFMLLNSHKFMVLNLAQIHARNSYKFMLLNSHKFMVLKHGINPFPSDKFKTLPN